MMARWLVFGVFLASAVVTQAQETPVEPYFQLWSSERAQINLRKQAVCAVRKYPADAKRVVIEDLEMRTIINSMPGLIKLCGEGALFHDNRTTISQPMFGFVLAEALVGALTVPQSMDAVAAVPPLVRDALPDNVSALPPKMRENAAIDAKLSRLDAAAECAVRHDPNAAWRLVTARPSSDVEYTSLQQLAEAVRTCDQSSVSTPPFIMRGIVAYNLYRLLDAAHLVGDAKDRASA
jgi:hypothetical protein